MILIVKSVLFFVGRPDCLSVHLALCQVCIFFRETKLGFSTIGPIAKSVLFLFTETKLSTFVLLLNLYCCFRKVLATMDKTRADAKVMKKAIRTRTGSFEEACKKTADLLNRLTAKATALEKLKAKVGLSKSLDAYLHLTEFESDEEEDDELLKEGTFCLNA